MKINSLLHFILALIFFSCSGKKNQAQIESSVKSLDLNRGDIALCGSSNSQFGTVAFSFSCAEGVRANFNLATALLHSFEYPEAEKVFAKVIDEDPRCVMAYWGAAMCNFHPLWEIPSQTDLKKGARIIAVGRSLVDDKTSRESDYLEAIATIYDQWEKLDHRTRVQRFEKASEKIYLKYPDDHEAAVFYALALRSSADPADKSFQKQKKAGEILNAVLKKEPNHPGITHYIIHTYDYPELAALALPAARKYALIAAASAHAQHMPSHIFTRLGLWDESIQSNINSIAAAQCYAQSLGVKGHWSEELHGLDYLIYAYLQKGDDDKAKVQMEYFSTVNEAYPHDFKDAYSFASIPARYALERKNWKEAACLELKPNFPWEKFPWEKANVTFARLLGAVHSNQLSMVRNELQELQLIHEKLKETNENYKANLVLIQVKISEGWIKLYEGHKADALTLMSAAAAMEDATEKHPVTPGEVIPARELLGDMYMETGEPAKAFEAYQEDLKRHPNRFNGLYGAGRAADKAGRTKEAIYYYKQLLSRASASSRPDLTSAKSFLKLQ